MTHSLEKQAQFQYCYHYHCLFEILILIDFDRLKYLVDHEELSIHPVSILVVNQQLLQYCHYVMFQVQAYQ